MNSPIANLVQQGTSLKPDITIQHDDSTEDPELAIHQTMEVRPIVPEMMRLLASANGVVGLRARLRGFF